MKEILDAFAEWFAWFALGFWFIGFAGRLAIEWREVFRVLSRPSLSRGLNRLLAITVASMFASGAGIVGGLFLSGAFWAIFPNTKEVDPIVIATVSFISITFCSILTSFFVTGFCLNYLKRKEKG